MSDGAGTPKPEAGPPWAEARVVSTSLFATGVSLNDEF